MKPDYKKYKLRKVETPEDKQRAIEETVDILKAALAHAIETDCLQGATTFRELINLFERSGYYVGFQN